MENENSLIVQRIQKSRKELHLTQQDLATVLGKTAAAISEMERGNTQVTAGELKTIARYFSKPIEYFYGESFFSDDVQKLIATIRNMPDEIRDKSIGMIDIMLQMQILAEQIKNTKDERKLRDLAIEFYSLMSPYVSSMNEFSAQSKDLQEKLKIALEISEP